MTTALKPPGAEKKVAMGKVVTSEYLKSLTNLYDPGNQEPCSSNLYILHSM